MRRKSESIGSFTAKPTTTTTNTTTTTKNQELKVLGLYLSMI
jgi:hypothetical protein